MTFIVKATYQVILLKTGHHASLDFIFIRR